LLAHRRSYVISNDSRRDLRPVAPGSPKKRGENESNPSDSGPTPVVRGEYGADTPPLAARPF